MSAPAKSDEIDPLLHPAQVAKFLGVSLSWLAKSRLNGTGPRFIRSTRAVGRARLHPEPATVVDGGAVERDHPRAVQWQKAVSCLLGHSNNHPSLYIPIHQEE
jgi:hypothetical protein